MQSSTFYSFIHISLDEQAESEASSSDASMSAPAINAAYKRYSEENLLAAIKAVLEEGTKQADASVKYGIPFTTLTRKIRLYCDYGGRLPRRYARRKDRPPAVSTLALLLAERSFIANEPLFPVEGLIGERDAHR